MLRCSMPLFPPALAILLHRGFLPWQGQDVEDGLRWPADPDAPRGHDDRPVDESWMGEHLIGQLIVAPTIGAKLTVGSTPALRMRASVLREVPHPEL
jgi:hypothetical protein